VSIEDLVAYRMQHDRLIIKKEDFDIKTRFGDFRLRAYLQTTNNQIHIALTKGSWKANEPVLTRINSTLVHSDILSTLTNNADEKLGKIFNLINNEEKGAIVFINQDNRSLNLLNRLHELRNLQSEGIIKTPPIIMDNKDYGIGAQIRHDLELHKLRLISNAGRTKRVGMTGYGLEIIEYVGY